MTKTEGKHKDICQTVEDLEKVDGPTGYCLNCEVEVFGGKTICELCGGEVEQ